jgi:AcrR family transcriptional regulator
VARTPDLVRRQELLDQIVDYLAVHGLAQVTLRPLATALGVSINRLVHHFGSKEDLITAALRRVVELQAEVQEGWMRSDPDITLAELHRKWWRWMNAAPENLALVRLGYEAAALDTTVSGLPGEVRADQLAVWRRGFEKMLVAEGLDPELARIEASVQKVFFTGLVIELVATGEKKRLTQTLETSLERLTRRLAHVTRASDQRAAFSSS